MADKQAEFASWMNDLLDAAKETPGADAVKLLGRCGQGCARRKGAFEAMKGLREQTKGLKSRAEYVAFFRDTLHIDASEEPDGILMKLGKPHCTCPMAPEVGNAMLCECTRGHEVACWSIFFGKDVDVEIVESHLRGGKDCVIKIVV